MVPQSWIRFLEQPRHLRHRSHWNAALAGASSPPSSGVSVVLLVVHPLAFSFRLGPLWRAFSCRAVSHVLPSSVLGKLARAYDPVGVDVFAAASSDRLSEGMRR